MLLSVLVKHKSMENSITRRTFLNAAGTTLAASLTKGFPIFPTKQREHPAEGLQRENIVITDIKVTPLSYVHKGAVPDRYRLTASKDYLWRCAGLYVWKSDAALVEIYTNQGIVGIAEGSPYRGPDKLKIYTDKYITPILKGKNVFDVDFITNNQGHNRVAQGAWAGINNALWDIIGKAKGKPVYKLLSSENNPSDKVRLYASGGVSHAWYDDGAEDLIREALQYKEWGYDSFKFRNGTSWKYSGMTMEKYIPVLRKIREAVGPDFKLVIEKFPWEFETILNQLCPALEDLKFYWYEQPWPDSKPDALEKHIAINEAMPSVMVSGGESWWNRYQVRPYVAAKAMNIIQTDANLSGITEGWYIGQTVHEHGQLYCPHNWVGGLTTIANIHLVAGVPSGHMCELNQTYNPLKWEIFKEPYPIENGWLTIPEKPGYGVEIIDDVAKRFPFEPGSYAKPNPKFKGTGLPLWWS